MVVQGKPRKTATKADPPRPSPVSRIDKIASLKRYPDKDYALDLLHQMARAVAPIIHEYKFKVGTLCEMYPKNASLLGLNVNRGQKILIRLRPPHNDRTFFPMGDLIGTFLHELTHNVHGPHDARFYAFLDELRRKYETGAFLAQDYVCEENTLGAGFRAPWAMPQSVHQKRLEVLSKGRYKAEARRVGGKAPPVGDLRKAMLEAAERRLKDAKWCSHGSDTEMPEPGDLEIMVLDNVPSTRTASAENTLILGVQKYKEVIDLTREGTGEEEDGDLEIIAVDACEQDTEQFTEPQAQRVLRPSLSEQQMFSTSGGHFEMRSTVRYFISSSPGRTFIGDGLSSVRRKVVADLNFDHIIESTSYIEVPQNTSLLSAAHRLEKAPNGMHPEHTNEKELEDIGNGKAKKLRTPKSTKATKTTKKRRSLIKLTASGSAQASASVVAKRGKKEKKEKKPTKVKHDKDGKPLSAGKKKRDRKEVRCVSFHELFLP